MKKNILKIILLSTVMLPAAAFADTEYDSEGRIIRQDFDDGTYETYIYNNWGQAYGTIYDSSTNTPTGNYHSYGDSWAVEDQNYDTDCVTTHEGGSWVISGDGWTQTDSFDSSGRQTSYVYTDTDGNYDASSFTYNGYQTVEKAYSNQTDYENGTKPVYVSIDSPTVIGSISYSYDDDGNITYIGGGVYNTYIGNVDCNGSLSDGSLTYQDGNIVITNQWGGSMTFDSDGKLLSSMGVGQWGNWDPDTNTVTQTDEVHFVSTYNDDGSMLFERYVAPIDPDSGEVGDFVLDMKDKRYQTAAGFVWEEMDPQTGEVFERDVLTNNGFSYKYDADGRLIGHDHLDQFNITYNSDGSFVTKSAYEDEEVSITYSADGKVLAMNVYGEELGVSYDNEGNLTITNSNGGHETFDSSGHLVSMNSCYEEPEIVLK